MLVRLGLAVTCSVAAVTYRRQLRNKRGQLATEDHGDKREEGQNENLGVESRSKQQKTPTEEVKRVTPSSPARSLIGSEYGDKDLLLPEFDDILYEAELGILSPRSARSVGKDSYGADGFTDADLDSFKAVPGEDGKDDVRFKTTKNRGGRVGSRRSPSPGRRRDSFNDDGDDQKSQVSDSSDYLRDEYVDSLANDSATAELRALRETVKVLKNKEARMEAELLEYYDLEDQEAELVKLEEEMEEKNARLMDMEERLERRNLELEKLRSRLEMVEEEKNSQIAKLKERIGILEARSTKLADEAASVTGLRKDLEEARARNREIQKQLNTRVGDDKAELLKLKQKLATLETDKEDGSKRDLETEKKLQALREMEVEIVELRRTNKDLQYQKRELTVKLDAAEMDIEYLQNRTEEDILAEADEELAALRHANEDLARQVEGLQNDRFTEVEELVYLRWVNACLRYELRNYQAPEGQVSAMDLNKNLSPRSQEKAKQLMLQYAAPDLHALRSKDQMESGYESTSSETSSPSEDYSDISSEVGSVSGHLSKKNSLIKRLKSWTGRKDDGIGNERSPSSRSDPGSQRRRKKTSKGPLEALIIRNQSDSIQITTYGANKDDAESHGTASPTRSLSNLSSPSGSGANSNPPAMSSLAPIKTSQSATTKDGFNGIAASFQVIEKSVPAEISAKYPAFKDRHKAAIEREQAIKEKAQAEREKMQAEREKAQVERGEMPKVPRVKWSEKMQQVGIQQEQLFGLETMPALKSGEVITKPITVAEVEKRELRKPRPPPKPSRPQPSVPAAPQSAGVSGGGVPPPPPPPPPPRGGPGAPPPPPPPPPMGGLSKMGKKTDDVHRAPEVVEFYQSLMKRDAKSAVVNTAGGNNPEARNNMIGEIENRSTHLLAIKADVETQGEFVMSLAAEVRAAVYGDIKDVVEFVNWLDEELSFLVDERAVLKHFDWPEGKADAMREAAFEYQDLTKLLGEVSKFEDKSEMPCDKALKKMLTLLEKTEQSVYGLLRTRDMAMARYKEFNIPVQWMLDSGIVGKIKLASVKLARLYMKRVSTELEQVGSLNEPVREFLLLQGVRFAFRVHQFAGGFDPESMQAFESLRACANRPSNPPDQHIEEEGEQQEEPEEQ
ncbi:protein CHUP1, chloroplastic isoform X2 [Physcomitrium patens]|uniref:Chloroplast unusual positioning 1A n=1 Tax=Physcomitrium patens TaxID=3218 RepID=A2V813_PHYPA|nr:protein CHUP1, chloroplastic-like isoform X2 [Physcomitrium patens]PNR39689.1 hypothetical protein PHYPA_019968 [Physcomitrium patens]BAF46897.1 chloroplast unusual positioning 1A [Physcomitrium patens]|eukprot:XP_024396094.1 protein CHUP1, chloroplastic-like isoform X2 [Physcomitrella patens]